MNYAISPKITIIYVLFISVLIDITYGVLDYISLGFLPVSMLYRISILAMFIVVAFRQNDFQSWFVKSIMVMWVFCLCLWLYRQGALPLFLNVNMFLRVIFPMCVTIIISGALYRSHKQGKDLTHFIGSGIVVYGVIASLSIIFSFVTGIGRLTYGDWAFGIKSFFTGGNDIGLAMLVSLVFGWIRFWQQGNWRNSAAIILITVAVSLIGSRGAWGGVVGVTFCFSMAFLLFKKSRSFKITIIKVLILTTLTGVGSYVTKLVYDNFDDLAFQLERVTSLLDGVSPRVFLEKSAWVVLKQRDAVDDVFGQGVTFHYKLYEELSMKNRTTQTGRDKSLGYRAVEQDFLDLYGIYGGLMTACVLGFHLYFWVLSLRLYLSRRSVEYLGCLMALTMFLFHGLLAGHALLSAQVCTLIGSVYGFLQFRHKHPTEEERM